MTEQAISPCPLCRLLAAMKPESTNAIDQGEDEYALYSFPIDGRLFTHKDDNALLGVVRTHDTKGIDAGEKIKKSLGVTGYLASTTPPKFTSNLKAMAGRRIDRFQVDYNLLHGWLDHCRSNHTRCVAKTRQHNFFKVINCRTRQVVEAPPRCTYFALSYVWGKSSLNEAVGQLHDGRPLPELPKTVEDAIALTSSMGIKFLWVDKYCIDQNDEQEMVSQMLRMDLIYLNAELTIVAASGNSADAGLPGVSSVPRTPQPYAKIGNHVLVSLKGNPKVKMLASTWSSRSWTFQEAVLSRRLLIFTEEQVYFECRAANFCETVDLLRDWDGWNIFMPSREQRGFPWLILARIAEYSKRQVTYQSDTLKAFLGILASYQKHQHPVYHHYGVPILPPAVKGPKGWPSSIRRPLSDGFLAGLCWQQQAPGHRRAGFPSWSWTGWNIVISQDSEEYHDGLRMKGCHDMEVLFEDEDGSRVSVQESQLKSGSNNSLAPYIHLMAHRVSLHFCYRPDTSDTQPKHLPSGHKPCFGSAYWAIFNSSKLANLEARLYLLQETGQDSENHANLITNTFTGIILGDLQILNENQNTFVMVTQDMGEYHERIGHLILGDGHAEFGDLSQNIVSEWASTFQPPPALQWIRLG